MMNLTTDLASKILTGLHAKTFEAYADEPDWAEGDEELQEMVDALSEAVDRTGMDSVAALAEYVKQSSAHVTADEVEDYMQEHFKGSGHRVGDVLKEYAENSDMGPLHELFEGLDKAGAVDWFDWEGYADSGQGSVTDLHFLVMPTTGTGDRVFLFED